MSRHVNIVADKFISDLGGQSFDLIALPGQRSLDIVILRFLMTHRQTSDWIEICPAPFGFEKDVPYVAACHEQLHIITKQIAFCYCLRLVQHAFLP